MKWGKGYAWNPVSFIDRAKNPEHPRRSLTLTTALIPVYKYVNDKFGEPRRTNFAAKLFLLPYDTDIDLMVLTGPSRTTRYGCDFSKNLTTNLVHGEFAVVSLDKMAINASGQGFRTQSDALSP